MFKREKYRRFGIAERHYWRDAACAWALLTPLLWLSLQGTAQAQTSADEPQSQPPIDFETENLVYDDVNQRIVASGQVKAISGTRVLTADRLIYDRAAESLTAEGSVRFVDQTGDTITADRFQTAPDFARAVGHNMVAQLADGSRFKATTAERQQGGDLLRITEGSYSPCRPCKEAPHNVLWEIKAGSVERNREKGRVIYEDATFELAGIPLLYTPYFSHADPTAPAESGLLTPSAGYRSDLGLVFRQSYFALIDPSQDATIEAGYAADQGAFAAGEYRLRIPDGRLRIRGSLADTDNPQGIDRNWRGHIFAEGQYNLTDQLNLSLDIQNASDRRYLRQYDFSSQDVLTSRLALEHFSERSFTAAQIYRFQDLRPEVVLNQPRLQPWITTNLLEEAGATLGGRLAFDGGLLGLTRDDGQDVARVHGRIGWQRQDYLPYGLVTRFDAQVLGAYYRIRDRAAPLDPNESTGRIFPQVQATISWPLVSDVSEGRLLLEPIGAVTAAPLLDRNTDLPNEDSQDVELDRTNLFALSRFTGVDQVEPGTRLTYGMRAGLFNDDGSETSIFVGQSFRFRRDDIYPGGSGLNERTSDAVIQVDFRPSESFEAVYRGRLGKDFETDQRHELNLVLRTEDWQLNADYLFLNDVPGTGITENRNQIELRAAHKLNDTWTVGGYGTTLLGNKTQQLRTGLSLTYQDECFYTQVTAERDLTNRDLGAAQSRLFVRIALKNIGEIGDAPDDLPTSGRRATVRDR